MGYWICEEDNLMGRPLEVHKCSKCGGYGDSTSHTCSHCNSPMAVEGSDYILIRRKNGNYERRKLIWNT